MCSQIENEFDMEEIRLFKFGDSSGILSFIFTSLIKIDMAIIDLDLDDDSGFVTAKKIYDTFPQIKIVVISKSADEIEKIFEIRPAFFLYCPVCPNKFISCLKIVIDEITKKEVKFILLKNKSGVVNIMYSSIFYIESDKRQINVYGEGNVNSYYAKLDDIQNELDESFLRCHKSYLVNMNRIKEFLIEEVCLTSGVLIPISQKRYSQAKTEYLQYFTKK